LENHYIHHNTADCGGGLYNGEAGLYAKYLHVSDNTANHGGGVYCSDGLLYNTIMPVFENIGIHHNNGKQRGGGIFNYSQSLFLNALIYDNLGASGATIYNAQYSFIGLVHATVTKTTSPMTASEIVQYGSLKAFNSIICLNGFTPPAGNIGSNGTCQSLFYNPLAGNYSLNAPLPTYPVNISTILISIPIISPTAPPHTPLPRPCNMPSNLLQTDLAGNPRPQGTYDITNYGAYEYDPNYPNYDNRHPFRKSMGNNEEEKEEPQPQPQPPISEKSFEWNLQLFPNPTTGELHLQGYEVTKLQSYEIYDVVGQLVQSKIVNLQSEILIDVSHLAKGMYFLKLTTADGSQKVKKFVKE
jgi:hypothetical protein